MIVHFSARQIKITIAKRFHWIRAFFVSRRQIVNSASVGTVVIVERLAFQRLLFHVLNSNPKNVVELQYDDDFYRW